MGVSMVGDMAKKVTSYNTLVCLNIDNDYVNDYIWFGRITVR